MGIIGIIMGAIFGWVMGIIGLDVWGWVGIGLILGGAVGIFNSVRAAPIYIYEMYITFKSEDIGFIMFFFNALEIVLFGVPFAILILGLVGAIVGLILWIVVYGILKIIIILTGCVICGMVDWAIMGWILGIICGIFVEITKELSNVDEL
jgi:hypothetical protein